MAAESLGPTAVQRRRGQPPAAARAALDGRRTTGHTFDAELTLYTAEELSPLLAESGCEDIEHCGIRTVADHIADDARKHDPDSFTELEALELALTSRHPYPHTARILQLLGRAR
ncbi:hypothetical protein ACFPA8_19315 [Streptomyces ovatisporus]|uniref:Uncharacterized protein n=1 Tax=Streptomyces ovatisporus TaxID=1128682 RepID=A0ABV9ABP0_9ACTN